MQKQMNNLIEEKETLKSALEREGQVSASLKVCSQDSDAKRSSPLCFREDLRRL